MPKFALAAVCVVSQKIFCFWLICYEEQSMTCLEHVCWPFTISKCKNSFWYSLEATPCICRFAFQYLIPCTCSSNTKSNILFLVPHTLLIKILDSSYHWALVAELPTELTKFANYSNGCALTRINLSTLRL